ncbi:Membrane protein insertase YidC 2, partial [Geodia barretti]
NYRLHANSQVGDGAPYGQTESPNQVHERAPTSHEGDPDKHKGDRQRASQETMKLYRDRGVNPLGCLGPMFIQFPIWIGLYQSIVHGVIPIDSSFLWLDLARPDPTPFVMPVLVGVSMWVMQKMTTMPSADERQASTNRMMLWMMPAMFGFFTLNFPSGLALYWVVSNVVGLVIQGFVTGWDPIINLFKFGRGQSDESAAVSAQSASALVPTVEETTDEGDRDIGQNGRRSNRASSKGTRRRPQRRRIDASCRESDLEFSDRP